MGGAEAPVSVPPINFRGANTWLKGEISEQLIETHR